MKIFGKEYTKNEIQKRIGDISQLGGIKSYKFSDGQRDGLRGIDIKTPSGLDMTVLPGRCLDIPYLAYKSTPLCWRSVSRETTPAYYESRGNEWVRTFFGGFLQTNGLDNIGDACIDEGEELGFHGRISNLAAENVWADGKWDGDSYSMWVRGKVREAKSFGDKLELSRKIIIKMDVPRVLVEDTVENIGSRRSPIMILYHINIGFPIVDNTSRLLESKAKIIPMDEVSKKAFNKYSEFSDPIPDFKNQVFFHEIEPDSDGNSNVAIINKSFNNGLGIGIWLKYNKDNLPYLIHWKSMAQKDYVCGIEPANALVGGRKEEREKGNLRFIEPGEKLNYRLEFNILTSSDEFKTFTDHINL